jgi:hypothetical protein
MSDTHRFFVAESHALCEQVRLSLDAAWGHPTPDGKTATCFAPADRLPHDADGRPMLAVDNAFCEYEAVAAVLPSLLAAGSVWEITRAEYLDAAVSDERP